MALREIRQEGDEVLRKKSRPVELMSGKILTLIKDMADTMYNVEGVGLAAPQIGVLRRIVVIDVGEGLLELINPEILEEHGEQIDFEGCLSVLGEMGEVKRPQKVVVQALNASGEKIVIEGENLLARALCHEIDHLNGILFIDKATKIIDKKDMGQEVK